MNRHTWGFTDCVVMQLAENGRWNPFKAVNDSNGILLCTLQKEYERKGLKEGKDTWFVHCWGLFGGLDSE